ncbi:MAG: S8 family serine peptidase, partial [Kordiimonadaceae bacterium]|nr:S8 family serine peptidase [Kordiimonadaceae bacterium]
MKLKKLKYNNILYTLMLASITSACGGAGSGPVTRSPAAATPPVVVPTPTPTPTPLPDWDTAEYRENYSLEQMKAETAYENDISGLGIIVAVIDSGVTEIPELTGKLHPASTNVATGSDADTDDYNGHGTGIAGIIAARQDHATNNNVNNMHGVAFNAQILAINATTSATCSEFG